MLEEDFDPNPTVYNEEDDDIEDVNIDDMLSVKSDLRSVKEVKKMGKELPPGLQFGEVPNLSQSQAIDPCNISLDKENNSTT